MELTNFTNESLRTLILFASLTAVVFLIKGGYSYITSSGKPDSLVEAKVTIRNALIGLILVISSGLLINIFTTSFTQSATPTQTSSYSLKPITPVVEKSSLTQVLIDSINGLLQSIVQSGTKPLIDGITSFLTTTPMMSTNSVVFNFWLTITGIVDTLFILVVGVIGFQFMSSTSFGFSEISLKQILLKLSLSFLGANTSIFLIDWVLQLNNVLVRTIISQSGGLDHAWVLNAINITQNPQETTLLTLLFMLLFLILAGILLLFYITRLITLTLGAVLSPFIFLLWALPKFADSAEIATKAYLVTIFTVFIHVVIILLASAFFTLPGQSGTNEFLSILVGIGILLTLLKTQSIVLQFLFFSSSRGSLRNMGRQIMNVINAKKELPSLELRDSYLIKPARKSAR